MITGKKILVISQNTRFLNSLNHNLTRRNYNVKGTRTENEELIRLISTVTPDLTILDTSLASMEGIRQLIGIKEAIDKPVMMVSTQGTHDDTVRSLNVGSYSQTYIKSLTFEELVKQIGVILR